MSLEAVKEITVLESSLEQEKADAAAAAKKRIADADKAGEKTVAEARAKAAEKVKEKVSAAESRAAGTIRQTKIEAERSWSALSDRAEANMDKAADLIVERVMGLS